MGIEVDLEIHIAKTPLLMLQTVNRLINTLQFRFTVRIRLLDIAHNWFDIDGCGFRRTYQTTTKYINVI